VLVGAVKQPPAGIRASSDMEGEGEGSYLGV
jgi:hypothetical protein